MPSNQLVLTWCCAWCGVIVPPPPVGSANGERRAQPPRREGRRYPPLVEMDDRQRREFHEALLDAESLEDLPGKWQAAILEAEAARPQLRVVTGE